MATITLKAKADHFNSLLAAPQLNKLKLEKVNKFKSHNEADQLFQGLIETIKKQGHDVLADKAGLPQIVPAVKEEPKEKAPAKPKMKVVADKETTELIESVIAATEAEGAEWYRTGAWIFGRKKAFGTEAKENRKVAYKLLDQNSADAVPEKGFSNTGEEITLRKQNGSVKWSAWEKTRRWTQYLSGIFQAIEASGWDAVFPDGQLVNKDEVNRLKKKESAGEDPIDTFKRSVQLAEKKLEEISPEHINTMEVLLADLNLKFAEFKKAAVKK